MLASPAVRYVGIYERAPAQHGLSAVFSKDQEGLPEAIRLLKRASGEAQPAGTPDVGEVVRSILEEIETGGDDAARRYAAKFDQWQSEIQVSADDIAAATEQVAPRLRDDIRFARDNIRRFAEAQKSTVGECEIEVVPGLLAGQKQIPVNTAGCYVPGGRHSHIASALMTVTNDFSEGHAELVVKFLEVTDRAIQHLEDEPELAQPVIADAAGLGLKESNIVLSLFDFYTRDDQLTERWMGGGVDTFLKEVAEFFQEQGKIDQALDDYGPTVDASYYEQVR